MSFIKRKTSGVLLVLALVAALVGMPSTAHATSVYDNNYTTTDSLFFGETSYYGINCPLEDITYDYLSYFEDPANWANSTMYGLFSSFEDAVDAGSWSVSQLQEHTSGGGNHYSVALTWNPTGGNVIFDGNAVSTWNTGDITATLMTRKGYTKRRVHSVHLRL